MHSISGEKKENLALTKDTYDVFKILCSTKTGSNKSSANEIRFLSHRFSVHKTRHVQP